MSIGIGGLETNELTKRNRCFLRASGALQKQSQLVLRVGLIRVDLYGRLQSSDGTFRITETVARQAQVIRGEIILRSELDGAVEFGGRASVVLLLEINDAQTKVSQGEVCGEANGLLELRDGCGEIVLGTRSEPKPS